MLTVKTYLAPSSIHGIGLFAAENIPANSIVWQYDEHIDRIYSEEIFFDICRKTHKCTLPHLLNSSYKRGGRYFYLTDNARFINHAVPANIAFVDDYTERTLRTIRAGEEILENYLLAYDASDFFFQEIVNPDPAVFINAVLQKEVSHAECYDVS